MLLKPFVCVVDAKLLKTVQLEILEPKGSKNQIKFEITKARGYMSKIPMNTLILSGGPQRETFMVFTSQLNSFPYRDFASASRESTALQEYYDFFSDII